MRFEHFGLNVPDARAMGQWYVDHLGFKIVRSRDEAPYTRFLADDAGRVAVELYTNPAGAIPAYAAQHPLVFHLAVVSQDVAADRARLEKAGATLFVEEVTPDGSRLTMLRDPWGVALQLCQRAQPFAGV
jgi:catechol 2,3-dioxygenase-like lactoylglutathione lyase family enzyme